MIALTVRYIGPTNTRGSRITASARHPNGTREAVTVPYRHEDDLGDNYTAAAVAWVKKFAPRCAISAASGSTGRGDEQVFFVRRDDATEPLTFIPVA